MFTGPPSSRCLRDYCVTGWQVLEIDAEMNGIQSLPFNKICTVGDRNCCGNMEDGARSSFLDWNNLLELEEGGRW